MTNNSDEALRGEQTEVEIEHDTEADIEGSAEEEIKGSEDEPFNSAERDLELALIMLRNNKKVINPRTHKQMMRALGISDEIIDEARKKYEAEQAIAEGRPQATEHQGTQTMSIKDKLLSFLRFTVN